MKNGDSMTFDQLPAVVHRALSEHVDRIAAMPDGGVVAVTDSFTWFLPGTAEEAREAVIRMVTDPITSEIGPEEGRKEVARILSEPAPWPNCRWVFVSVRRCFGLFPIKVASIAEVRAMLGIDKINASGGSG